MSAAASPPWVGASPSDAAGAAGGMGHGTLFPVLNALAVTRTPIALHGTVVSLVTATLDLGAVVGTPLCGAIADWIGYPTMFATMAAASVLGAVLMLGSEVLGEAHNETIARKDPTAHAEFLAIQRAISAGHSERLAEATLYITLEPCAQCAGAIVLARVPRVVFGAWDQRAGMVGSVYDILRNPKLNHRPEVVQGILEGECGEVLKGFFRAKRG